MNKNSIPQNGLVCHNLKKWYDWLADHHDSEAGMVPILEAQASENQRESYRGCIYESI
ncbi:MAG: hypothetical protein WCG21_05410 [Eubacteriales bacterium]